MAPKILIVPGTWEGPTVFGPLSTILKEKHGLSSETAKLLSTGAVSPGNPGLKDDVREIRTQIQRLVSENEDIVLVLHSAGAFLGSEAMQGLSKKELEAQGQKGGVTGIVFIAGAVFPEGYHHQPLPFARVEGNASYLVEPEVNFFSDFTDEEREKWIKVLEPQPAHGWDDVISYTGWKVVPSFYVICEKDQILPVPLQEQLAALAGSKIERVDGGHLAHLTQTEKVAGVIKNAVESF
ncbi:hypothetical protein N7456_008127 [Penicillium angulare]|uniref:AB hydrolase-1 domain-containing protein n=1 Tax=Penicillium angulare TaxID=116970 RepID=A0A9W9FC54_9EURO|nr:hypothetical protein N7456_008127 [Penicillium angulare]